MEVSSWVDGGFSELVAELMNGRRRVSSFMVGLKWRGDRGSSGHLDQAEGVSLPRQTVQASRPRLTPSTSPPPPCRLSPSSEPRSRAALSHNSW